MSLGATLATAFSGLRTAQQGLNLTAHNVSNVNTEGFTRKVLPQESVVLSNRGAGVSAEEVTRLTDKFLSQEARRQSGRAAQAEVVSRFHDRLQDFIGAPGENRDLAVQMGALAAAVDGFANSPEASANALEVVNLAESVGLSIESLAAQVQRLRTDADREIGLTVSEINGELNSLAEINREVARLSKMGQDTSELLDQRDLRLKGLAEKIDVDTFVKDNDILVVQTRGGHTLVDEQARVLHYDPAAQLGHDTVLGRLAIFRQDQISATTGQPIDPDGGVELVSEGVRASLSAELDNDGSDDDQQLITSQIQDGRLAGLLEVRDRILPAFDDQLVELADGVRFALNAAHNSGAALPPPNALSGTRTDLGDFAGATRSGSATIAVVDRTTGGTVDHFQIDVGNAAAADESALVTRINDALTNAGIPGSASLADGNLVIDLGNPDHGLAIDEGDSTITITDAAGRERDYGFSHYFGLNDLMVTKRPRATTLTVRDDVRSDPSLVGTARLDVQGGIATLGGRGDNRAAQALADALRSAKEVIARGELSAKSISMTDYAGEIIANSAILAQQAQEGAGRDQALADALEFRASASSGVNIDEEMTHMILLQRAYTASARIISTTEQLFDELFRIAG